MLEVNQIKYFYILAIALLFSACSTTPNKEETSQTKKNEVIVLGMIHGGHTNSKSYGIDVLKKLIREIDPDYILTEIPPDRYPTALKEFQETDSISEPRVRRFPEYIDVVFPLTKEMDFKIIPTAGWTRPMAEARRKRLNEIREDSTWSDQWAKYIAANKASDSVANSLGKSDDPYFVNSTAYDNAAEISLSVYNELFNDELGLGGWDNINEAHYGYIEKALNEHTKEGKRILITYGAGHKGWFLRQLRKREDIDLVEVKPFLDKIQ